MADSKWILAALAKSEKARVNTEANERQLREAEIEKIRERAAQLDGAWNRIYQPAPGPHVSKPNYWRDWHEGILQFCRVVKSLKLDKPYRANIKKLNASRPRPRGVKSALELIDAGLSGVETAVATRLDYLARSKLSKDRTWTEPFRNDRLLYSLHYADETIDREGRADAERLAQLAVADVVPEAKLAHDAPIETQVPDDDVLNSLELTMKGKPWQLFKFVWKSRCRRAGYNTVASAIWPDGCETATIEANVRRAETQLRSINDCRWSITHSNKVIFIEKLA
ncbi:MAG: hypothetical protein EXS05_16690 [Planctomycetaceae bacterium]|nr:hypothetical protein [Planctomycetaceae bacterium]